MAQDLTNLSALAKALGITTASPEAKAFNDAFGEGIFESYPIVSVKGKEWTLRLPGQKPADWKKQLNADDEPARSIPLILLRASPGIAKSWWPTGFDEKNPTAPLCYSTNGKVPDEDVLDQHRQNPICATCEMNKFGSAAKGGKTGEGKACGDSKVLAVIAPTLMEKPYRPAIMRVPATSLKNIKEYTDELSRNGIYSHRILTKASFVQAVTWPMIEFAGVKELPQAFWKEFVEPLLTDETTERMLKVAINAGNFQVTEAETEGAVAKPAPKATPKPAPIVVKPTTGFEGMDLDLDEKPAAKAPETVEEAEEIPFEVEDAPAPKPAPASAVADLKAKRATVKTPAKGNGTTGKEPATAAVVVENTADELVDVISSLFPKGVPTD
jgi:hypothetical protein